MVSGENSHQASIKFSGIIKKIIIYLLNILVKITKYNLRSKNPFFIFGQKYI